MDTTKQRHKRGMSYVEAEHSYPILCMTRNTNLRSVRYKFHMGSLTWSYLIGELPIGTQVAISGFVSHTLVLG